MKISAQFPEEKSSQYISCEIEYLSLLSSIMIRWVHILLLFLYLFCEFNKTIFLDFFYVNLKIKNNNNKNQI